MRQHPAPSAAAVVLPATLQVARWTVALLVATLLLVLPVGADAAHAAVDEDLILAVEDGELGPEPQPRDAPDNPARSLAGYEDRDVMFTWGASFLLLGLVVTLLVVGGTLWYLLVVRPNRTADARG